jgi:hypothetical protein
MLPNLTMPCGLLAAGSRRGRNGPDYAAARVPRGGNPKGFRPGDDRAKGGTNVPIRAVFLNCPV